MNTIDVLVLVGIVGFVIGIWWTNRHDAELAARNRFDPDAIAQTQLESTDFDAREARLKALYEIANDAFTPEDAANWMRYPHPMLDRESPRDVGITEAGFQRVMDLLINLKYGGVV